MHRVEFTTYNFLEHCSQGGAVKKEHKKKRKLREGNIISNSFIIYLFPPCGCGGIFNSAARGPGCADAVCPGVPTAWAMFNLSCAGRFQPSHCYYLAWHLVDLTAGHHRAGLRGHTGGCLAQREPHPTPRTNKILWSQNETEYV